MAKETELYPEFVKASFRTEKVYVMTRKTTTPNGIPAKDVDAVTVVNKGKATITVAGKTIRLKGHPMIMADYIHPRNPAKKYIPLVRVVQIEPEEK